MVEIELNWLTTVVKGFPVTARWTYCPFKSSPFSSFLLQPSCFNSSTSLHGCKEPPDAQGVALWLAQAEASPGSIHQWPKGRRSQYNTLWRFSVSEFVIGFIPKSVNFTEEMILVVWVVTGRYRFHQLVTMITAHDHSARPTAGSSSSVGDSLVTTSTSQKKSI